MKNLIFPILIGVFAWLQASLCGKGANALLILSDDHRYDFMSFMDEAPEFLETPNLDRLAEEGAHLANAFVTTSLCSPSRASILTGQYMRHHRVVDNQRPVPEGTRFFPEYLQDAGYSTGYAGKWHMGHEDDTPRKGFDHWVSFAGQGTYFDPTFNINGKRKAFKGYNADLLTDQAVDWLKEVGPASQKGKPFFLQVGYKAVHYPFQPPPRHAKRYEGKKIDYPETMANTEENYLSQSHWIRERRYGIHGIDHMETGSLDKDPVPDFDELYHNFCETVHALDENIGRILRQLDELGIADDTLIIYLGDNGFALGEHGFYDKRDAFEESIRIPMLARHPKLIKAGTRIENMALNVDLAPTILEFAGVDLPTNPKMDGHSFLALLQGKKSKKKWRDISFMSITGNGTFQLPRPPLQSVPMRKNTFITTESGIATDFMILIPILERHNLIRVPAYQERILELREQLFDELDETGGLSIPIRRPKNEQFYDRKLRR